jgi:hypothetical protein
MSRRKRQVKQAARHVNSKWAVKYLFLYYTNQKIRKIEITNHQNVKGAPAST